MILDAARAAFARLFTPEFRGVFWKSLGITLLALAALWLLLERLFATLVTRSNRQSLAVPQSRTVASRVGCP